jgi:hypothetical protein
MRGEDLGWFYESAARRREHWPRFDDTPSSCIGEIERNQGSGPADPDLHDFGFGVILTPEQIDVRHVLLADSHFAPIPGARTSLQAGNSFSLNSFLFSLTKTL